MNYAGDKGIPLPYFLGEPITTRHFDATGTLTGWSVEDSPWSEDAQEYALAWDAHQRACCPTCGIHPAEWDESRGGDRNAYRADLHRCRGDELLDRLDVPKGEMGLRKVLVPNIATDPEGGEHGSSDVGQPPGVNGDAGDAPQPAP